ncbi:hypothetical protein HS7_17540 [Sulfolobales archaeon HS-7]|nr:hypothetical protein HS7_17540 [Sulfolobales archaeon HS-7]
MLQEKIKLSRKLRESYTDYKYLLNRGYKRELALRVVTDRYTLTSEERLILYRCTHSDYEIYQIRAKLRDSNVVVVDGFNIASIIINLIKGDDVYECDDGFPRDKSLGKYKGESNLVIDAIILLAEELGRQLIIYFDYPVSRSGEIASGLRKKGILAEAVNSVDKKLIESNIPVLSTDFVVLIKTQYLFNPFPFLLKKWGFSLFSLFD